MATDELDDCERDINQWIRIAWEDFDAASLLAQAPYLAPACYHCQQAVEKILKAYIIVQENSLTKTHDLVFLIKQCEKHSTEFSKFDSVCFELTQYATVTRYPATTALTIQIVERALEHTRGILDFTMSKLAQFGYEKSQQQPDDSKKKLIEAIQYLSQKRAGHG